MSRSDCYEDLKGFRKWIDTDQCTNYQNSIVFCTNLHHCKSDLLSYQPYDKTKQLSDECDKSYDDLQDMIIIIDDLNVRFSRIQHKRRHQHVTRSTVRSITVDTENKNGTRLIDFGEINNILISNTFF